MLNIFDLEKTTAIPAGSSYILSYPHLLSYFEERETLSEQDVVCGAHMVYGWMPRILAFHPNSSFDFSAAASLLNKAKTNDHISNKEITSLTKLVNNSLVGTSKLLHFVAPQKFAIWDSKIYQFVFNGEPYQYRMSNISNYRHYLDLLDSYQKDERFGDFHKSVNKKMGYDVFPLRALELIMFLNAPTGD